MHLQVAASEEAGAGRSLISFATAVEQEQSVKQLSAHRTRSSRHENRGGAYTPKALPPSGNLCYKHKHMSPVLHYISRYWQGHFILDYMLIHSSFTFTYSERTTHQDRFNHKEWLHTYFIERQHTIEVEFHWLVPYNRHLGKCKTVQQIAFIQLSFFWLQASS